MVKRSLFLVLAALLVAAGSYVLHGAGPGRSTSLVAPNSAVIEPAAAGAAPAELGRLIRAYEERVRARPDSLDYAFLGRLYLQQARETADAGAFARAQAALEQALDLYPDDLETRVALGSARYATHDFRGALSLALAVLAEDAEQSQAVAVAGDARLELGDYGAAAADYSRLAERYPRVAAVEARLARLAFLRGDVPGARELAARAATDARNEGAFGSGLAWYEHLQAQLAYDRGDYHAAVAFERRGLEAAPSYHVALAGLARALAARGGADEAIAAYARAIAIVPQPEYLAALGDLYDLRGEAGLAAREFGAVDVIARLSGPERALYDRQLALFLLDHGRATEEPLAIALASLDTRPDVYGHDLAAWALYRGGRFVEARAESDRARTLGTADARLLYHAGMISKALGESARARDELSHALAIGPAFDPLQARVAGAALASLQPAARGRAGVEHPLGNFTINHYLGVVVRPDGVLVDYVLDMAEIPAFQERPVIESDPARTCRDLAGGLLIRLDGRRETFAPTTVRLTFPPGQGGLDTLRLECGYRVDLTAPLSSAVLDVQDRNHADRIGWREIVARGEGVALDTTLPRESISARLTAYPQSLFSSPLDVRSGAARLSLPVRDALPISLPRPDDPLGALAALALALGLGAFHALTPGHGKTVMAAYLVGTRGTRQQALILALAVALSHTAGVLGLALLTLAGSAALAPDRAYPYLSALSGALVLALGAWMVARRWAHARSHRDRHSHAHDAPATALGWRSLATLGLAGGVVPSASALVLLLGAISLHRVELGVVLVAAFGAGMAVSLVGLGQALVGARGFAERRFARRLETIVAWMPALAAVVVLVVGLGMTAQSLAALL